MRPCLTTFMYFPHPKSRYLRFVKPAYDNFVQPTSRFANIVSQGCYLDVIKT